MLTLKPLNDYVNQNHWSYAERVDIQQGNAYTIHAQIFSVHANQPYHPQAGATVTITFPRAPTIAAFPANQDVVVSMTVPFAGNTSVWQASITAAQASTIASGSAILSITEGGITRTYVVDHFVEKAVSSALKPHRDC